MTNVSTIDKINEIRNGKNLDVHIHDNNPDVRAEVASQGYGLDNLINDADAQVRAAVARQGYGIETLFNDDNEYVRDAVVIGLLRENN